MRRVTCRGCREVWLVPEEALEPECPACGSELEAETSEATLLGELETSER